jgi:hypothetical protein
MKAYQERVVQELRELNIKLANLRLFLNSATLDTLSNDEQALLKHQSSVMSEYADVLEHASFVQMNVALKSTDDQLLQIPQTISCRLG